MSLNTTFPSDISNSTTGQRSRRAHPTRRCHPVDAAATAAPSAAIQTDTTTADTHTNNSKHNKAKKDEPQREMLETTQLFLEDLRKESRLFHSPLRETIPTFLPQGVSCSYCIVLLYKNTVL